MCIANCANSLGSPNRWGNWVDEIKGSRILSGAIFIKGVSKIPGEIVFTLIEWLARSLAAVSVNQITPAFEAL